MKRGKFPIYAVVALVATLALSAMGFRPLSTT